MKVGDKSVFLFFYFVFFFLFFFFERMETDCLGLPILYNRLGMVASLINSIYDLQLSSFFFFIYEAYLGYKSIFHG